MAGNKRATTVRLKYQEFVWQQQDRPEIIVEGGLREQAKAFRTEDARNERL